MPYGTPRSALKRTPRSSGYSSKVFNRATQAQKYRAVSRARKINQAVAKKLRKPFVPKYVKHRAAITTLARQVNRLQRQQLGLLQKNIQIAEMPGIGGSMYNEHPIIFVASNFYNQDMCPIWRGSLFNHDTETPYQSGKFVKWMSPHSHVQENTNTSYFATLQDDICSPNAYAPVSMLYQFGFELTANPNHGKTWFRVQLFKCKRDAMYSTDQNERQLPLNAYALTNMAMKNVELRNSLPKEHFKVIQDRWVSIDHSQCTTNSTTLHAKITLKHVFPKGTLYKPDMEQAVFADEGLGPTVGSSTPAEFHKKMPKTDLIWCLVSTSLSAHPTAPIIHCKRFISWRDQHGTA